MYIVILIIDLHFTFTAPSPVPFLPSGEYERRNANEAFIVDRLRGERISTHEVLKLMQRSSEQHQS